MTYKIQNICITYNKRLFFLDFPSVYSQFSEFSGNRLGREKYLKANIIENIVLILNVIELPGI